MDEVPPSLDAGISSVNITLPCAHNAQVEENDTHYVITLFVSLCTCRTCRPCLPVLLRLTRHTSLLQPSLQMKVSVTS